jgi:hypothetical protein
MTKEAHRNPPDRKVEFYFRRLSLSGATLVVLEVGAEIYGACDPKPSVALLTVVWRASEDLAKRSQSIDSKRIIERGHEELRREGSIVEGAQPTRTSLPHRAA